MGAASTVRHRIVGDVNRRCSPMRSQGCNPANRRRHRKLPPPLLPNFPNLGNDRKTHMEPPTALCGVPALVSQVTRHLTDTVDTSESR